jgi:lysylphosphatidylglycerol synthetase-like protein (DUF2156 family)
MFAFSKSNTIYSRSTLSQEDPRKTLYFAHLFLGDHLLNTIWTVFFAVAWWVYNPHDGKSIAHSEAQKKMMDVGGGGPKMSDEERARAAQIIWNKEKGTAAFVLIAGWLLKVWFVFLEPALSPLFMPEMAWAFTKPVRFLPLPIWRSSRSTLRPSFIHTPFTSEKEHTAHSLCQIA